MLAGAGSLMLAAPAVRAQGQNAGVALVIGNSKYQWEAQLPNVRRDAPDIARRFRAMGLATDLLENAGAPAIRRALAKLKAASASAPFAALYFAGHGAYIDRTSYVLPVDVDLAEALREGKMLRRSEVLVAEENHAALVERTANLAVGLLLQGTRQIHAFDAHGAVEKIADMVVIGHCRRQRELVHRSLRIGGRSLFATANAQIRRLWQD